MPGNNPTREAGRVTLDTMTDYAQEGQSLTIPALPRNMLVPVVVPAEAVDDFRAGPDRPEAVATPGEDRPPRSPLVPAVAILSLAIAGALAIVPMTLPSAPHHVATAAPVSTTVIKADPRAYLAMLTASDALQQVKNALQRVTSVEKALASIRGQEAANLVLVLPDIGFPSGGTTLSPAFQRKLAPLAKYLTANPHRLVIIKGYTDNVGTHAANLKLSNQRAETVKNYLAEKGAGPERILTVGYGEADPVVSNETPAGRKENRRVEIVLVDSQTAAK